MPEPATRSRSSARLPGTLLALLGSPAAVAAIAPHLPVRHWAIDLPASFCLQGGVAAFAAAITLLLLRRWLLGALYALAALAAVVAVMPALLPTKPLAAAGAQQLTVLTMNLLREGDANAARALAEIERVDPDVLFLSEVTPAWRHALEPRLAAWPHRAVRADPGWFGLGLYSKLPFATAEILPLGFDWAPCVRAAVVTADGPIGVLAIHPPRPGIGPRCGERDAALAAVAAVLAPLPPRRIVLGDCNCTPWNRAFPAMLAATGLLRAGGLAATWDARWPWPLRIPIDHVLVGGGVAAERVEVGAPFGSDHAPLWARLRW